MRHGVCDRKGGDEGVGGGTMNWWQRGRYQWELIS